MGAPSLYLNFINLFMLMPRLASFRFARRVRETHRRSAFEVTSYRSGRSWFFENALAPLVHRQHRRIITELLHDY
jgi:hypothetical protein